MARGGRGGGVPASPPGNSSGGRLVAPFELAGPAAEVAPRLLGCLLVRRLGDGRELRGRIVEVEAYGGPEDLASHARFGPAGRSRPMFAAGGLAYVYLIYGMHHCFNVVTGSEGEGAAVLVRALEPLVGITTRSDGPGRLCRALGIDRSLDACRLVPEQGIWLEHPGEPERRLVERSARIGIGYAGEPWLSMPWRFFLVGSRHLSRRG